MLARQRRAWTTEEDQQLIEAVRRVNSKSDEPLNWCAISKNVPNRSNKDCRKRWISTHAGAEIMITKGAWSEAEDDQLRTGVQIFGPRWCRVAKMVPGRNSDQCAKRWKETLDPTINRSKWTLEEDELLLKAVGQMGRKWTSVVKQYFPGRTGLAAKNRYNCLVNQSRSLHSKEIFQPVSDSSSSLGDWSVSSSSSASSLSASSPISPISPSYTGPEHPFATLYTSNLDFDSSTMVNDALDSTCLAHLHDVLFDFRSISSAQSEILLIGGDFESPSKKQYSGPFLKLYGSSRCCSTARIAVVLYEKQIGFELYPLNSTTRSSDVQPHINDNGIVLYGCRNICQYIATRYPERGTKLIPDLNNTRATELFGQAKLTENQIFEPFARNALYETIMKQQQGLLPSEAIGSFALQELLNSVEGYESILGRQKYLAGNEISLVDLYHLPYGEMLCNIGIDVFMTKGSNVSRWWTDISSRPSWLSIRNGVPSKG